MARRIKMRSIYTPIPMWECPACGQRYLGTDSEAAFKHEREAHK